MNVQIYLKNIQIFLIHLKYFYKVLRSYLTFSYPILKYYTCMGVICKHTLD